MPGLGGAWRSLVAHLLWEQGVGGSNPLAPIGIWRDHFDVSPQGLLVTVPPSDLGERRGAGSEQVVDVLLSDRLKTASMKGSVTGSLSSRPSHPSRGVTTVRRVSVASSP